MDLSSLATRSGSFYDPPYDSPIQDLLAHNLVKHLGDGVSLEKEVPVETPVATFRIDLVMSRHGVCVGIECDGSEYHDEWRDEWRDAMILATRRVSNIWRIPGKAINTRINIVMLHLADAYPDFFSTRGRGNIETLALHEGRAILEATPKAGGRPVLFEGESGRRQLMRMVGVEDRSDGHWRRLHSFAVAGALRDLDKIIEKYEREVLGSNQA